MFKVGQKIVRQRDRQVDFQKINWESHAKRRGFDPYAPVEVLGTLYTGATVYIKEIGFGASFKAELFESAGPNSNLEDWL